MEHLPQPFPLRKSATSKLVFPCRCDPNLLDDGPLETYPERKGFRLNYWGDLNYANTLTLADGSKPDVEQSTTLLQEWLFFGMLRAIHKIYGTEFNGYDYVEIVDNDNVLTLKRFPEHVQTWYRLEAEQPKAVRKQHFRGVEAHMLRALRFLSNNFTDDTAGSIGLTGPDNVIPLEAQIVLESKLEILLAVLNEAMDWATKAIYFQERKPYHGAASAYICLSTYRHVKRLAWCPSELNFCTSNKCLAFELEDSVYQPAHVEGCDGCRAITIDSTKLGEILESNDHSAYPRVNITITDDDEINLSMADVGSYVAISHVWSDGLGYPPGVNSLPECQVRRLRSLIQEAGMEQPAVWIDSLRVPCDSGPAKRNALARMAKVYSNAKHVLVLDSDLMSTPSSCCSEELLLQIALSKWMRRLWTLEEGVVGRSNLLFQFRDRAIPLPLANESFTDNVANNCVTLMLQYLPSERDIASVITALHFRSTTWNGDEPLCIGYILDLDVVSIIAIDDFEMRMLELYRLLSEKDPIFPFQFLFTDEEKLTKWPFRWAPRSLLNLEAHDVFYLQGMTDNVERQVEATQTNRGLRLRGSFSSCLLAFKEGANIKNCMIFRMDAVSYVICPVRRTAKCRSHGRFWEGLDKEDALQANPHQDWTEIWRTHYDFRPTGNWGLIYPGSGSPGYGVMVAIEEATPQVFYGKLIGQVHIYEIQTSHSTVISGLNKEFWGQLGIPMLDEDEVRREQERRERAIFDPRYYSYVECRTRFEPGRPEWCIG
ncbi:hypothetical protein LTR10_014818 [Elasticomyces elasticus]|uniref:Heterokaryon incompatibility domain-containing protein n=1 Tax=Exophiala sideris TaxID=1016849 RepID=A0ABR0JFX6_9EURO|nr:hypothetical protein LTR10_014818 [Elasticomyces elasticus]KAK5025661.1 hypothetical protein LTS07_007865 [Exophiala sideris]KAK5033130.1 hypothetical protein LTR13_007095 [Exophiala sideris]KAK5063615.1 hypothetical protein LTR69_004321 [Exophiala sideris]KAK5180552.1 hypothetical protein LTR44_006866 [Eurotiomycetes sp. CCFEE 6388]